MGVHFKENEEKITLGMIITGIAIIAILLTSLIIYLLNVNVKGSEEFAEEEHIVSQTKQDDDEFETVSIDIGKSVDEASNELNAAINAVTNETKQNTENTTTNSNTNTTEITSNSKKESTKENTTTETKSKEEAPKEIKFTAPIKGEIIREFAPDSLVYSETLDEWVTHNGVDIKADKTSVVAAACEGTVYAIKNDPRYGLTVIVNHDDEYQTIYANLLTAEFVVQGETIQAGQTIGTVGNTATFEISDDCHLHFEMLKDGQYINPSNYMQF